MLSLTKKLYFKYKRSRIKTFDDLLYYLEKITVSDFSPGLMLHFDLEESDHAELFPLINRFNPLIDMTYTSVIPSYHFFLVLYMLYDEKKPVHMSSNLFNVYLKDRFDQDMLQGIIHKYDRIKNPDLYHILKIVVDHDGTTLLNFFVNQCLNEWREKNNPDYLLMFMKSYFEFQHDINHNIKKWFFDIDILREELIDILCLINDYHPQWIGMNDSIDHQRLISAYHVSCALEIPLLDAIKNNNLISLDLNMEII